MINEFPDGRVPYEMQIINAAKFIGVEPWKLEVQEYKWFDYASIMQTAESRASNATYTRQEF